MSDTTEPQRRSRFPRRARIAVAAGAVAVVGVGVGLRLGHVSGLGAASPSGSGPGGASASLQSPGTSGANQPGGAGAGVVSPNGGGGKGPSAPGTGGGGEKASSSTSPTPHPTLAPIPKPGIAGKGDWNSSNCAGGFSSGDSCTVQYSGEYFLDGTTTQTVLMKAMTADGTVLASQAYPAPAGGHRFGARLTFVIPKDVREVDMVSDLQDASGKILASSVVQQYFSS
jgi:hypothetical protein